MRDPLAALRATVGQWIERLAEHLGVLPSYIDQDGGARVTSDETRRAILAAMGFPMSSEQDAEERLNALLDEGRKRLLEPVVVHERGAANPRVRAHAPRRGGALRWKIEIRSERGRVAAREGLYDSAGPLEIETPNLGIGYYDVRLTLTGSQGELEGESDADRRAAAVHRPVGPAGRSRRVRCDRQPVHAARRRELGNRRHRRPVGARRLGRRDRRIVRRTQSAARAAQSRRRHQSVRPDVASVAEPDLHRRRARAGVSRVTGARGAHPFAGDRRHAGRAATQRSRSV